MGDEETGKVYELQSSMYRLASPLWSSKAEQSPLFLIFVGRVDSTSTDEKAKECSRKTCLIHFDAVDQLYCG